jgi:hypothetical protein
MPFTASTDQVVIVVVEDANREWLQAADIILSSHRWRWRASRWLRRTYDLYPGCLVAVAGHTGGRWCLIRLPDRTVLVRGRNLAHAVAVIGGAAYTQWLSCRRGDQRSLTKSTGE